MSRAPSPTGSAPRRDDRVPHRDRARRARSAAPRRPRPCSPCRRRARRARRRRCSSAVREARAAARRRRARATQRRAPAGPGRRASRSRRAGRSPSTSKPSAWRSEPGEVARVVGGVRDGQEAVRRQPVGEEVVEHAAVLVAQHGVLRAAVGDPRDVVGEQALQERLGARARPSRPGPCGRRRTRRRARARPGAPRGCRRTGPASPSPRTARAARRRPTWRSCSGVRFSVSVSRRHRAVGP